MLRTSLLILLLSGCSASHEIARSANNAGESAHAIIEKAEFIERTSDQPEVAKTATSIKADAHSVLAESNKIGEAVTRVKDITPAWMVLLMWLAGAVVCVAVCVLLWQTGIGTAIRAALSWIPRRTRQEAAIAANVIDPGKDDNITTLIAAKRAKDPLFDKAFAEAVAAQRAKPTSETSQPTP